MLLHLVDYGLWCAAAAVGCGGSLGVCSKILSTLSKRLWGGGGGTSALH